MSKKKNSEIPVAPEVANTCSQPEKPETEQLPMVVRDDGQDRQPGLRPSSAPSLSQGGKADDPASATGERTQDEIDISRLRVSQDFDQQIIVKKAILAVPVRKPGRQEFIRVHPDPAFRMRAVLFEDEEARETYIIVNELHRALPSEFSLKMVYTAMKLPADVFLWPIRLPGADGRTDLWSQSAHDAAAEAMTKWCRVISNMPLKAYEVKHPVSMVAEPAWPDLSFDDLLRIAFKNRVIQSLDHPVLRKLRGEF